MLYLVTSVVCPQPCLKGKFKLAQAKKIFRLAGKHDASLGQRPFIVPTMVAHCPLARSKQKASDPRRLRPPLQIAIALPSKLPT